MDKVYKEEIQFLDNVLDVLNRIGTSVVFKDDKYIVMQNNVEKYEIGITKFNAVIREYHCGYYGKPRIIEKHGVRVKNRLWLLHFKLQEATDGKPFDQIVQKVRWWKNDINNIRDIISLLKRDDTVVEVLNETMLMKDFMVNYTVDSGTGFKIPYQVRIKYNGSIVSFGKSEAGKMEIHGIQGQYLKVLRKKLDESVDGLAQKCSKETKGIRAWIRFKLDERALKRSK